MKVANILLFCTSAILQVLLGQSKTCPSEGIAYLPQSKCTQFNICLDSEATELTCPFGLYYNSETTHCDFPENVGECGGGTRPPISTAPTIEPSPTTEEQSKPTEEPGTTTELPTDEMTECGQSIIADNGTIRYKLNEPYDAGELCIFMIQFESGHLNSTFTLDTSGFSDSDPKAVTVFRSYQGLGLAAQLGASQNNVSFTGYGAVVIFRTNSSSGTGFQLSFKMDAIRYPGILPGTYVLFDETTSHLDIPFPFNYTGGTFHSYFFFTVGHKMISEPNTFLNLTVFGVFGNKNGTCANVFNIYSFENELKNEKMICWNRDDYREYQFSTRGLFYIYQQQVVNLPITTGVFKWAKVSTS